MLSPRMITSQLSVSAARVWLIGGTQDSAQLALHLARSQVPFVVSVTSAQAIALYAQVPACAVVVERFEVQSLNKFLNAAQIVGILDATHPHAQEISKLAMQVAQQYQLPYLRYERPIVPGIAGSQSVEVQNLQTLVAGQTLLNQRVLLTIGYQGLGLFQDWQERSTLFVRVLPTVTAIAAATTAGFSRDRTMALYPPVPADLERALWQHWQISMVVTKASGQAGGEEIKRQIAAELGIQLVVIRRPQLTYLNCTDSFTTALQFCQNLFAA